MKRSHSMKRKISTSWQQKMLQTRALDLPCTASRLRPKSKRKIDKSTRTLALARIHLAFSEFIRAVLSNSFPEPPTPVKSNRVPLLSSRLPSSSARQQHSILLRLKRSKWSRKKRKKRKARPSLLIKKLNLEMKRRKIV